MEFFVPTDFYFYFLDCFVGEQERENELTKTHHFCRATPEAHSTPLVAPSHPIDPWHPNRRGACASRPFPPIRTITAFTISMAATLMMIRIKA